MGQDQSKEDMMKYVCLWYQDEAIMQNMSKEDMDKLNAEYRAFGETVQKSGQLILGQGLQSVRTATTVRVRDGNTSTTEGPAAETREQLGGIYLIEAKDLNDAVRFAAKIPNARNGSIEVRPVWTYGEQSSPQLGESPKARRVQ